MNTIESNITGGVDSSINQIYLAFNGAGFQLGLFIPALILAISALISIPFNISICIITVKYRTLHSNTCILLALNSFFEILHGFGHFIFLAISASGTNFLPLRLALPILSLPLVGSLTGSKMTAQLSVDRLLAVAAPIFYNQVKTKKYIFGHCCVIVAFNVYYYYFMILGRIKYPEWPCTGSVGDFVWIPGLAQSTQFPNFFVFSATIFVYLLVGILIKFRTEVNTERQKKIFLSLMLIVSVTLTGYVAYAAGNVLTLLSLFPLNKFQFWYFSIFTLILMNIGSLSNAPILFYISTEHRNVYFKEFEWLKRIYKAQQETTPVTIIQQ